MQMRNSSKMNYLKDRNGKEAAVKEEVRSPNLRTLRNKDNKTRIRITNYRTTQNSHSTHQIFKSKHLIFPTKFRKPKNITKVLLGYLYLIEDDLSD